MTTKTKLLTGASVILLALAGAVPTASAAEAPTPSQRVCSGDSTSDPYACMKVNKATVPSGNTAVFTGTLSKQASSALAKWTKGDNIVCLTRYKTTPEADGSWPWTVLDAACTTVRKDGNFTIRAEFGRKGTFYYGLEMGPCRGDADLCGAGDPGLVGVINIDNKALALRTS